MPRWNGAGPYLIAKQLLETSRNRGVTSVFVYQMIVKKNVTSVFRRLNKGDYEFALSGVGRTIEHRFAGEHCLGGKRTSTGALRRWFQRLFRLFPNLGFEIHSIVASGWPCGHHCRR